MSPETLVLANGTIWTGDRFARSVVIVANRIASVDGDAPGAARVIDLKGRLAVPGFIDNHVHFISGGFQLSRVQLRDATSSEELARRIGEHTRKAARGEWITGGDWDEQRWTPAALPTRQAIDAATPHHPVFVTRNDLHMGLANSAALSLAGITRDTEDPPGGTIVRDADGEPTGVLKDAAMRAIAAVIPPPSIEARMNAARAGLAEAARVGVTSFCDMGMSRDAFEDFRAYQRLEAEGALTARVSMYLPISDYQRLKQLGVERRFGSARLRIGGLKGFADGSLGSSTAAFREAYVDDASHSGLLMQEMNDGSMRRWVEDADEHELQIALHAIGDRANHEVLSIFETRPNPRARRFRIEHAQHLDAALVERFGRSGVIASAQPYHAIDDGRWAEKKVGAERARMTYPFRSLLDAGATLTFGSDWPVAPIDPMAGVYAAVTRRTIDGAHPSGWIPQQRITVEEALRAYTASNAWAIFADHELGRIAPGMLADIVVLSDNVFDVAPEKIRDVRAVLTICDGAIVHEA
jgi:predicted amidohydrolase YtcJ